MVALASLHHWEEPAISGSQGSGTIFFSHCNLACRFCQNWDISQGAGERSGGEIKLHIADCRLQNDQARDSVSLDHLVTGPLDHCQRQENADCKIRSDQDGASVRGKEVSVERLREIAFELKAQGAHNINLVSPTPYSEMILDALLPVKKELGIPVVWNTNAYELVPELKRVEPLVDVYLPDLKFLDSAASRRYCGQADYFEFASKAIREMHRQKLAVRMQRNAECGMVNAEFRDLHSAIRIEEGSAAKGKSDCRLQITDCRTQSRDDGGDDTHVMTQGVIIRHLVIPGLVEDSKAILRWIAENIGTGVHISLMAQYTPVHKASRFPEINRRLRRSEFEAVSDCFYELGFENGWVQELSAASPEYTPEFNLRGT